MHNLRQPKYDSFNIVVLTSENSDPDEPELLVESKDNRVQFMMTISSSETNVGQGTKTRLRHQFFKQR